MRFAENDRRDETERGEAEPGHDEADLADGLLKPSEAARFLRISERLFQEHAHEIPAVNVGRGTERRALRYLRDDLLAWARSRRTPAG